MSYERLTYHIYIFNETYKSRSDDRHDSQWIYPLDDTIANGFIRWTTR